MSKIIQAQRINPCTKGIPCKVYGGFAQTREISDGCPHIFLFANPLVVLSFTPPDTSEIQPERGISHPAIGLHHRPDNAIVHITPIKGMGVRDYHRLMTFREIHEGLNLQVRRFNQNSFLAHVKT